MAIKQKGLHDKYGDILSRKPRPEIYINIIFNSEPPRSQD